jgi:hypothetical protein
MKPTWVVENFTKEKSFIELTDAIKGEGCPLVHVTDGYSKSIFNDFSERGSVVLQGSIGMLKYLHADFPPGWKGLRLPTFENYLCSKYYSHFGDLMFNDKYWLLPLRDVQRQRFYVYATLGKDGLIFIRPDSGEKTFQAQLVDIQDLDEFCRTHEDCLHSLVLVSTPKNIEWEGRFVCFQNEIIAHSTYKFQEQRTYIPAVPKEALECCKRALKVDFKPDDIFCLDVCGSPKSDEFYVLELNAFQSSGLYACDKAKVVNRINEIVSR